jgi:Uncharacterized membrane protein
MTSKQEQSGSSSSNLADKLNALRAGVLGANDGIISTAGLVVGVAGATTNASVLLISGLAGLVAGALSMAGGEYVSVSTQRDTELATIAEEKRALKTDYQGQLEELKNIYREKGLSEKLAGEVAVELMDKDPLRAHAEAEFNIDPDHYANPLVAAFSSMISFTIGAFLPLAAILLLPESIKIIGTFATVLIALALTGSISAKLGGAPQGKPVMRNVVVGAITMAVTYGIGYLVKT